MLWCVFFLFVFVVGLVALRAGAAKVVGGMRGRERELGGPQLGGAGTCLRSLYGLLMSQARSRGRELIIYKDEMWVCGEKCW